MRRDADHVYRSALLDRLEWLDHGFGSRSSGDWLAARPVATLQQVHSARVVDACGRTGRLGEGDALVTRAPGKWAAIRTADCYPVIVADGRRRAAAVVHAGWRGAAAEIVTRAIAEMGSRLADLTIAIGPGIGACCYEVGPEVARQFQRWVQWDDKTRRLDLLAVLSAQLAELGVKEDQVDLARMCTFCSAADFHSYRRDGLAAGRMVSGAAVEE